jgi:hypothetical protein
MKIEIELKKEKGMYSISSNKGMVFVCYGRTIKEVFNNLKMAFVKFQELNQLGKEIQ